MTWYEELRSECGEDVVGELRVADEATHNEYVKDTAKAALDMTTAEMAERCIESHITYFELLLLVAHVAEDDSAESCARGLWRS